MTIFFQDLKERAVYWFLFPLLAGAFIAERILSGESIKAILVESLFPTTFVFIQLFVLSLYFSLKEKRLVNITSGLLGMGDILFLLSACVYFSLLNYIAFYIVSLISVIAMWSMISSLQSKRRSIPLAGLQSLALASVVVCCCIIPGYHATDDSWFYNIITRVYAD